MKYIDTTAIRNWAQRRDCQDTLPLLVRKLIRATVENINSISFPSGDNVLIGGWDGIAEIQEQTEYLPEGKSLWEFGSNKDIKGKADSDYEKRKGNPLGFEPPQATFIFITPRLWTKKDEWIKNRKEEKYWKDVRVYDAQDLEEWIETVPAVGAWLAVKHLGILPQDIQACDDFWEEWSTGNKIRFTPSVVLAGRDERAEQLTAKTGGSEIIPIKAASRDEAIAFIVAAFKNNERLSEDFFARALIVDTPNAFRELILSDKPMFLILRFSDDNATSRARNTGHQVYVPLSIDNSGQWSNMIELPPLERKPFVQALMESGIIKEEAEKLSKGSARNLSVLRRQLEFNRLIPKWAEADYARDLIPALFAGRWDEDREADQKLLESLSGENYGSYAGKVTKWLYTADAPLVKIGNTWRLTSPLDAWTNAGKYATTEDFIKFQYAFQKAFSSIDPKFTVPPGKEQYAWFPVDQNANSRWLREGMLHTMILISVYGEKIKLNLPAVSGHWADQQVNGLMSSNAPGLWKTLDRELPLLAEASPESFLKNVEELLKQDQGPIHQLFEEEAGLLHKNAHHTGLLWALESLAWMPIHLTRVSLILAHLSEIDPGGTLSNRPINSLKTIYKPWFPQTTASLENRLDALKVISKSYPKISYPLLLSLLPTGGRGSVSSNAQMKWRLPIEKFNQTITYGELAKTHSAAVDMLLAQFSFTEENIKEILQLSVDMNYTDREKIFSLLNENLDSLPREKDLVWHALREMIYRHSAYPNADWALSSESLKKYEALHLALTPIDPIEGKAWVLKEHWPKFLGYNNRKIPHAEMSEHIHRERVSALRAIYSAHGLAKILEIASELPAGMLQSAAFATAEVVENPDDLSRIYQGLSQTDYRKDFAQYFIDAKRRKIGIEFLFERYEELEEKGMETKHLVNIFMATLADKQLWEFIAGKGKALNDQYWTKINANLFFLDSDDMHFGIKKLLEYGRYSSAVNMVSYSAEMLDSSLILEILKSFITKESEKDTQFDTGSIEHMLEELRKRENVDKNELIKLEWLYLPLFHNGYGEENTPMLHRELSENPQFFIDIVEMLYQPDSAEQTEEELSDQQRQQKAMMVQMAYRLMDSWKQIPGVNENWEIDVTSLRKWISEVLALARDLDRLSGATSQIGGVFAHYPEQHIKIEPERDLNWPPDILCEIMEEIDSEALFDHFKVATQNKRGFSSRGAFEGGKREWHLSKYFSRLAELKSARFPKVAAILTTIAKHYGQQARRHDERAERDKLDY